MIIETVIKTPQFKDGKIKDYTVQRGKISTVTWTFEPIEHVSGSVGMHRVIFHEEKEYLKYKVE